MEFDDVASIATMPTLYYDAVSSHARSCQMLVQILNIDIDLKSTDSINDINSNETYTWINSFFKLPTLVDGGITLCNGHSILIYLCQKYDPHNLSDLWPCDYVTRQKLTSVFFFEGCVLHRCLNHLMTDITLAKYPNFNAEYHKAEVLNVYNSLNAFLNVNPFMIANYLTIADISVLSSVSALSIIFPIDQRFPKLFDWFEGLKKMEFYNCNDEGILKLRYILRKIGKFPFPSPFDMESKRIAKGTSDGSGKTEEEKTKTKNLETPNQTHESENSEGRENLSGYVATNQNGKTIQKSDTFDLDDIHIVHEPKCNCCYCAESKSEAVKFEIFTETTEIYKKPETVSLCSTLYPVASTDDTSRYEINGRVPQQRACLCCCSKEMRNSRERELAKRRSEKAKKNNLERRLEKSHKTEKETDLESEESTEEDDSFTATDSEDNTDDDGHGEVQEKFKRNKICESPVKQKKKVDKDKHHDNNVTDVDGITSNDITVSTETNEAVKTDSSQNNENKRLTNQEIEDKIATVRKLKKIIEMYERELQMNNQIATVVSDNCSIDSIIKTFPRYCGPPSTSLQQKYHPCNCHNKLKKPEQVCRVGSRVEALDFDEVTHIVMPQFLVTNFEKLECPGTSPASKDDTQNSERLEAGGNCNPCPKYLVVKDFSMAYDQFKNTSKQFDNKILQDIIIYVLNAKMACKNKNICCCKKKKAINSKIPRLISQYPFSFNSQD